MKTNLRALRIVMLSLACVVIASIMVFDLQAAGYCYRYHDQTWTPQSSSPEVPAYFNLAACWPKA